MDLFVRAGRSDNLVIDELIAPASAGLHLGRRVPMRALVVDGPTVIAQPALRESAEAAGLPLLIDPLTALLQDEQPADSSWASLPFGAPEPVEVADLASGTVQDELIERTLTFELDHGASVLIPPYVHARSPADPWWGVQLGLNRRTAAFLRAEGITLPVAPVLAGQLLRFGSQASWSTGVDAFIRSVEGMNVRYVPLALSSSPASNGDTEDRLGAYLATVRHLAETVPIVAWRQGQYGMAAAAAGAIGYQTGPGTDERCDLPAFARNRRPKPQSSFGAPKRVYLAGFARSVSEKVADVLLASSHLRGALTCGEPSCCPDGATSMLSRWRQHALRTRSRQLDELRSMPDQAWRLNHVARHAEHARVDARTANQLLEQEGLSERLPEASFRALTNVADALRSMVSRRAG